MLRAGFEGRSPTQVGRGGVANTLAFDVRSAAKDLVIRDQILPCAPTTNKVQLFLFFDGLPLRKPIKKSLKLKLVCCWPHLSKKRGF